MNNPKRPLQMKIVLDSSQTNDLARPLKVIVEAFYQNPENEKRFQAWLKEQKNARSNDLQED